MIGATSTLAAYSTEEINAKLIFEHAAKGDPVSFGLVADVADRLGFACVNFCRTLDPEVPSFQFSCAIENYSDLTAMLLL